MGHLRVTVVTIGHLRATRGHLKATKGHLKATIVYRLRVTIRFLLFYFLKQTSGKHK